LRFVRRSATHLNNWAIKWKRICRKFLFKRKTEFREQNELVKKDTN
jgi:hypothetical protein